MAGRGERPHRQDDDDRGGDGSIESDTPAQLGPLDELPVWSAGGSSMGSNPLPSGLRPKESRAGFLDWDADAPRASKQPAVSFSSNTAHILRASSSATMPSDPHVIGPQISRLDAERAGRLYLQSYAAADRASRISRSRRSSSRATARCHNALPQSLRDARPDLMNAVLDGTSDGAQLKQSLAAVKRANTDKLNEFVGRTQAEITVCQRQCKGRYVLPNVR